MTRQSLAWSGGARGDRAAAAAPPAAPRTRIVGAGGGPAQSQPLGRRLDVHAVDASTRRAGTTTCCVRGDGDEPPGDFVNVAEPARRRSISTAGAASSPAAMTARSCSIATSIR